MRVAQLLALFLISCLAAPLYAGDNDPPPQVDAVSGAGPVAPDQNSQAAPQVDAVSGAGPAAPAGGQTGQPGDLLGTAKAIGQPLYQAGASLYRSFSGMFGGGADKPPPAPPNQAGAAPDAGAPAPGGPPAQAAPDKQPARSGQAPGAGSGRAGPTGAAAGSPEAGPAGASDSGGAPGVGASGAGSGGSGGGRDAVAQGHAVGGSGPQPSRMSAAAAHAQKIGDALKAGLGSDAGELPEGAAGADAGATPRRDSGGGLENDLDAAAASGFAASFQSLGLKMGSGRTAGQVLRADGSPASDAEVAALRRRIAEDPQELLRRPDLFEVLPREEFLRLKTDFRSKPGLRSDAFRDIGLTKKDRDFVHDRSCDKNLESDCNPHAQKPYRAGEFVSPEDLKAIDQALHPGTPPARAPAAGLAAAASPGGAKKAAGTPPPPAVGDAAAAALAAAAQMPGLPPGARQKAQREYFANASGQVADAAGETAAEFLRAWSGRDPRFAALAQRLDARRGKPNEERAALAESSDVVLSYLHKHPEAKEESDPQLAGLLRAYVQSQADASQFYRAWLASGSAAKGTRFYESELTPGRDTELAWVEVDQAGGRRGLTERHEDGSTLFASDDGSLQVSAGKADASYCGHLKDLGVACAPGAAYQERVELKGGKPSRRLVTLDGGRLSLEDRFSGVALSQRTIADAAQGLTTIVKPDGSVTLQSDRKDSPWLRQEGALDASGRFQPKTIVNARGLELTVERGPDGAQTLVYEPVKGMRGAVDQNLNVTGFDIDAGALWDQGAGMRLSRQTADLVARVYGWPDARAAALASFISFRLGQSFCSAGSGCPGDIRVTVLRSGQVSMTGDSKSFQGGFQQSAARGKAEEALVYHYFAQTGTDKWVRGPGALQSEDFGDGQHYEVAEGVGAVDADADGTLNEEKMAVALHVYGYQDGRWTVTSAEKRGEYTIYKAQSRWAYAASKMGNLPVIKQTLDVGKSAVDGVEGGILFAGSGITELWNHDRSLQLRAHAWSTWGDVGISGVIDPAKDAGRQLAEEDARKGMGDDVFNDLLVQSHQKATGWSGDDAAYRLKFGDAALRSADVRNAVLDKMSAEHAADYYMDKCHDGGSDAWCAVGVGVNVGKSMLEMPVMVGGMAGLELKAAGWAARGARVLGAGADTVAAVYDTTRFGFTAVNTAQMAVPAAADAAQAIDACRKGRSDDCKDHISGLAAAAGSLGAFHLMYSGGAAELNRRFGARDAGWLADAALSDYKAGKLELSPASAKLLESVAAAPGGGRVAGVPERYASNPQGLVADIALGKVDFVERDGALVAVKPAARAAAPAAPKVQSLFKSKADVVKSFGADPYAVAEKSGIRIGGQGGGGARLVELGGEQWVLKSRRLDDPRAREAAQNELLTRELVRRFFSDQFETTDGVAYEDGSRIVTLNRYDEGAKLDRRRFLSMSDEQRASLSVLAQVFGLGDINYGNVLFGKGKPVLIDFESVTRDGVDTSKYPDAVLKMVVDKGHAPFLDRASYNDPALYERESAQWKQRFQDPAFQAQLDEALARAGITGADAAAYKQSLARNLDAYQANMGRLLAIANAGHPAPEAAAPPVAASGPETAGSIVDRALQLLGLRKKTQAAQAPISGSEVDALFAQDRRFDDHLRVDVSNYPPKDWKTLRETVKNLGGSIEFGGDGIAQVRLPSGARAAFEKSLDGTPARVLTVDDQVAHARAQAVAGEPGEETAGSAPSLSVRELRQLWDHASGLGLASDQTVRAGRQAAVQAAHDPELRRAVAQAAQAGRLADAGWQGKQGGLSNCVPHAFANSSNGVFSLAETQAAGEAAGADYTKAGTTEAQLLQMMVTLQDVAAKKGVAVDYRAVPIEDFFRQQDADAAAGLERRAGIVILRTRNAGAAQGLHAAALRGQIVVGGQHYIVLTDSHLDQPLLYTPEAFSEAAAADGVVMIDVVPKAQSGGMTLAGGDTAAAAPDEAKPAPDGDGGHGEHGSVEERQRAKQLDVFVVDPAGRVSLRPDGVVDLPSKPGYALVQRNKRTGALEVVQGDARALKKVEAFIARTDPARR